MAPTSARIGERFQEHAHARADHLALATAAASLTFAEIASTAEGLARAFRAAGLPEGHLVGLCLGNSLGFVPVYLALCHLSAVVALVSPKYGRSEIAAVVEGAAPCCLVVDETAADGVAQAASCARIVPVSAPRLPTALCLLFPRGAGPAATWRPAPGAALLKFTSGSTGRPKGIALSVDNLLAEAGGVADTLALTPSDRVLAPVPLAHSYGFDLGVLPLVLAGVPLLVRDGFVPRRAWRDLADPAVTVFLGVPSMYQFLIDTAAGAAPALGHLRYLLSCTAPLPPERIRTFHERFGAPLCQHYGSSETGAVATHVPAEVLARPDAVGRPMPHVRVRILDPRGAVVGAGETGEVVVDGGAVAAGYAMGGPEVTPFRDGSYWTGDVGSLDDHGFLTVHGRTDAVINVGGLKVYPLEVERVLLGHPAVREAAVVGTPDPAGGQVVCAAVTLRDAAAEGDLLAHCRAELADYKVPRRIEIRADLPRTATGKVALRAQDFTR